VIKIESTDPQVVYVPAYNPSPFMAPGRHRLSAGLSAAASGEQFTDSFVKGLAIASASPQPTRCSAASTGMMTIITTMTMTITITMMIITAATHNGDNININVNNFNHITGQNLPGNHANWQHNPAYRGNIPYPNNTLRSITIRPTFPAG
jgi:hypothetical protein